MGVIDKLMVDQKITKAELARRMKTSRAQLDLQNESVTLATLTHAAHAVGSNLRVELV